MAVACKSRFWIVLVVCWGKISLRLVSGVLHSQTRSRDVERARYERTSKHLLLLKLRGARQHVGPVSLVIVLPVPESK